MSSFQALMALSASQTKESQSAVQMALQERQRKEAVRRRDQEEKERKEKEREMKVRLMHFEVQKKEQERLRHEEEKRKAMELALQRREDEQRNALLLGPKKASKWPASTSGAKEAVRRTRLPGGDDDDGGEPIGSFFTREELRQQRQAAEQKRLMYASTRRSTGAGGYSKQGKRLPGGAVDITASSGATESGNFKSVKDRLAAQPITLTKLNVVKRDTRTIDEIVQDRAKVKILDGDKAREFSDWFGTSKKKEVVKKTSSSSATLSQSSSASSISSFAFPSASQSANSAVTSSGANTPVSQRGTPGPSDVPASTSGKKTPVHSAKLASSRPMHKPAASPSFGAAKSQAYKASLANGKSISKSTAIPPSSSQTFSKSHIQSVMLKKRPRSESRSESPPPKRRGHAPGDDGARDDLKSMIWNMFGRNRAEYISRDVFSDDEDMEADASLVEKEEAFSTRVAAKEDQLALEQERRHEDEKRRRKKEREARAASSR